MNDQVVVVVLFSAFFFLQLSHRYLTTLFVNLYFGVFKFVRCDTQDRLSAQANLWLGVQKIL